MRALLRRIFRRFDPDAFEAAAGRARLSIATGRGAVYAIGDVHGCLSALLVLETKIRADIQQAKIDDPLIIYLGDYVDRGPDSKGVLDHVSRHQHPDGIERIALCGNHEDAFLRFLQNPADNIAWLDFGGDATLRSYGLQAFTHLRRPRDMQELGAVLKEAIPGSHVRFLENLPILATQGNRVFVHAGIRPGIALDDQDDGDLLWIREPFLEEGPGLPVTVIHGHTAGTEPVFGNGRICIDTGCYATGRLTALKLSEDGESVL